MKCPKCQFDNPEGMQFCVECGFNLETNCPKCGFSNSPSFKFCGKCGHELGKPKESPSINFEQPQSYTPKYLADKILTTRSSIEGERKLVTVLFADVADYTTMAEKLDPEEVHQIMDGCFRILMDEMHKYEGTINQFTGDGVMALFGAPVAHEDHAQRACYAALSIQKAVGDYGEKIRKDTGVDFRMRIGLNSGPVIVGSIGDDLRMDYTAVGDTTNLASRMESAARPGSVLVSLNTHRLARDFFEFETLGTIQVKGKEDPQEALELIRASEVETRIGASVAKGLTRFVGRKNSIAGLMEAFEKAKKGVGQVVGMVGEAGVGKSRLLLEMRNRLTQRDTIFLEGRCLHYGASIAYLPILDILRSWFDLKEGDREFLIKKKMKEKVLELDETLRGTLPFFQDLLSLKVDDESFLKLEPKEKREMTFDSLRDLLIRLSQDSTIVLAVEDLHWIDNTSEAFLDYLIGWLANTHILLILLYRPEYTHSWGSKSYYTKIGLDQLGMESSSELVKAMLEEGEVAPELRQLILDRAAGNPLFMEELTHTLLENGSIRKDENRYVLSSPSSGVQLPDTVQGIISARLDRLEDNLKRTMQVASVIGRDFAFRILQTITGMREELRSYLINLQGLEFIYEKRLFPELEYIFKHVLTQEVAYNSLLQTRRKEIHEKIGQAIEQIYAERLEEFYEILAHHYTKSENSEKAYQYLRLSGDKASRNYANFEAFRFYKEAIKILVMMPETEKNKREQIEIRLLMAAPMFLLGYPEDSLEILQDGERLSKQLGDEKSLGHFLSLIGPYYVWKGGDLLLGIKYSEDAFKQAEEINDIELMAPFGMDLCASSFFTGENLESIIDVASKVIALLEKTQRESESFGRPLNVYCALHAWYAASACALGNFEKGQLLFEKGLDFALRIKELHSLALLEVHYGINLNWRGDGTNAIEHLQNSIKYCEEGQNVAYVGPAWIGLGWAYYLLGELVMAREHMDKGIKIQSEVDVHYHLSFYYGLLSMVEFESGDLKNAQHRAEEALKLSQKTNEKWAEGFLWILLGRILGKAGKPQYDQAEESILQGIRILDELKLKVLYSEGYLFLGELYANTEKREKALENLQKAEGLFREMGMNYWLAKTKETLERV